MRIIIKTKNIDPTEDLKNFVEKKVGSIKKFIDSEIVVEIEKETTHHKKGKVFSVKTQVILPGKSLVAWSKADDMFKAIIGAKDELKKEIEKYKFKKIDINRRQQRKAQYETEI